MAINPNGGNVGIGTKTPTARLDVAGDIKSTGRLDVVGDIKSNGSFRTSNNEAESIIVNTGRNLYLGLFNGIRAAGTWKYAIYDGDSNWDFSSDIRLKKDIVDAEPMLDRLMQLPFRRFRWKDVSDSAAKAEFGVIAQEVEPLFPDIVGTGSDGIKTVGYTTFATIACKALQEYKTRTDADLGKLNEQIHERDTKIEALEAKLAEQEKRSTAQADEVTSQNARLVALEKLINKSSPPETVSIKLGEQ
jgi:hypothetical protein